MSAFVDRFGWKPIDTAPSDQNVVLMVSDGRGGPHALKTPCRLAAAGWVSSSKGTPLAATPLQWKAHRSQPMNRFPPPWRIVEMPGCFIVWDATGLNVVWFYFQDGPTVAPSAAVLLKEQPGRRAMSFADSRRWCDLRRNDGGRFQRSLME